MRGGTQFRVPEVEKLMLYFEVDAHRYAEAIAKQPLPQHQLVLDACYSSTKLFLVVVCLHFDTTIVQVVPFVYG